MKYLRKFETALLEIDDDSDVAHLNIIKKSIDDGDDVNMDVCGSIAIIWAASRNYTEVVKMLIKAGADMNIKNKYNNSALIGSVFNDHFESTKVLINAGADINTQDGGDRTPLIYASLHNKLNIVKLLIEAGSDWNIKDVSGENFLDCLNDWNRDDIIYFYPEKYKEYLIKKDAKKYNL